MNDLNKNIKIFFIDLDGTLLDERKQGTHRMFPSEKNLQAIREAEKQGKKVVISTGRSGYHFENYIDVIKPKFAVLGNGAQIYKDGKIVKTVNITLQQSLLLYDWIKKNKLVFKVDDNIDSYGAKSWFHNFITKKFKFNPLRHYNIEMHKEYYKMVIWGKSKRKIKKLVDVVMKEVPGISAVTSSHGYTIEITNENATKGKGNLYVANKYFNIKDKKEMAHIGDTMNDSTVVDEGIRLIAMGNSTNELKSMTKYHGPSFHNGGVAKILNGEYKKIS